MERNITCRKEKRKKKKKKKKKKKTYLKGYGNQVPDLKISCGHCNL